MLLPLFNAAAEVHLNDHSRIVALTVDAEASAFRAEEAHVNAQEQVRLANRALETARQAVNSAVRRSVSASVSYDAALTTVIDTLRNRQDSAARLVDLLAADAADAAADAAAYAAAYDAADAAAYEDMADANPAAYDDDDDDDDDAVDADRDDNAWLPAPETSDQRLLHAILVDPSSINTDALVVRYLELF